MSDHGKRYQEARAAIDRETAYSPVEAVRKLKAFPDAKFDETVEVHFRLGLNVRHADEQLRGTLSRSQLRQIAEIKLVDLNARDVEQAMKVIAGTARSMGVEVEA